MPGRPADLFNDFFTSEPQEIISYHEMPSCIKKQQEGAAPEREASWRMKWRQWGRQGSGLLQSLNAEEADLGMITQIKQNYRSPDRFTAGRRIWGQVCKSGSGSVRCKVMHKCSCNVKQAATGAGLELKCSIRSLNVGKNQRSFSKLFLTHQMCHHCLTQGYMAVPGQKWPWAQAAKPIGVRRQGCRACSCT